MSEKRKIPFVKMQGIGNDYIYIDCLRGETPDYLEESKIPDLSKKVSERHFGVGSDGLILILPSDNADFRMRIFNADGSEAKMCGNGVRCVGKYVRDFGFTDKDLIDVETESGIKHLQLIRKNDETVSVIVDMGRPFFKRGEIPATGNPHDTMTDHPVNVAKETFKITGIGMGNPHGVIYVNDVDNLDLHAIGPTLENHPVWPDRANIEFVEVLNPEEIKVRVWERGSEETMACGTGACASAVASYKKGYTGPKVKVHLKGGTLEIEYNEKENRVKMTGPAAFVASGEFFINE